MRSSNRSWLVIPVCFLTATIICQAQVFYTSVDGKATVEARINELLAQANVATDPETGERLISEAQVLLKQSGSKLTDLTRLFLSSDVLRVRGQVYVRLWRDARDDDALRTRAGKELRQAIDGYEKLVVMCEDTIDLIERRLGEEKAVRDPQWRKASGLVSRGTFFEGWAYYNLGIVAEGAAKRKEVLQKAADRFASFIGDGYRRHPIVAEAFLGLALCRFELEQHHQVIEVLKDANAANTQPEMFRRITFLRIKANVEMGSLLMAENAAKQYFDSLPDDRAMDGVDLRMMLERARCLTLLADVKANPEFAHLFKGRLDSVSKTLYTAGDPWRSELAGLMADKSGSTPFSRMAQARQLFNDKKYAEALESARQGLAAAGPDDTAILADLRYTQAAAAWNLKSWASAYRTALVFIREHPKDRRADAICSRALQALSLAAREKPGVPVDEQLTFFALVEKDFPQADGVENVPWYRGNLLLKTGRLEEAALSFRRIAADSPCYLLARYGLALTAYRLVEQASESAQTPPSRLVELLGEAARSVEEFVGIAADPAAAENDDASVAVADIGISTARRFLGLPEPRAEAALAVLADVDRIKAAADRLKAQRLALTLEANLALGRNEQAAKLLEGALAAPDASSSELLAGLARLATPLEAEYEKLVKAGDAYKARALDKKIAALYSFLLSTVGRSSGKQLAEQEVVVRQRLAESLLRQQRYEDAGIHYSWLIERLPRAQAGAAMRGMALCHQHQGQHEEAAKRWIALANGLAKHTASWYEARYELVRCYQQAGNAERARKLIGYYLLQDGDIRVEPWNERFDALARELGVAGSAPARD